MSKLDDIITDYGVVEFDDKKIKKRIKQWALGLVKKSKRQLYVRSYSHPAYSNGMDDYEAELRRRIEEG